jgi:hypothetical protein
MAASLQSFVMTKKDSLDCGQDSSEILQEFTEEITKISCTEKISESFKVNIVNLFLF